MFDESRTGSEWSTCRGDEDDSEAKTRHRHRAMRRCDKGGSGRSAGPPPVPRRPRSNTREFSPATHGMEATRVPFRLPKPRRNENKKGESFCPKMSHAAGKLVMLSVGREG